MPKFNAVLMVVLAAAVIAAMGFLALRPTPAQASDPVQIELLLRKLADPDPDVRREGESGLKRLGSAALGPLQQASRSGDRALAGRASKLLQELQPPPPAERPSSAAE